MQKIIDFLWKFGPAAVIIAPFLMLWNQLNSTTGLFSDIAGFITSATAAANVTAIGSYVGQANRFVPLSEMFVMVSIYLGLSVACAAFRMVKSWIPTIG